MKVTKEVKAEIVKTLKRFEEVGIAEPPYVCISGYPFEGVLHTDYGSVRFVHVRNADAKQLYIISRRDYRLAHRRKARKANV